MNSQAGQTKAARRQHYIARFYLRNFADPMFSENLCVYDMDTGRWNKRSSHGVGWFTHLCSSIDMDGRRKDDFDRFLKQEVEDPAAPAIKKLATGQPLDARERSAVALFIALTAARSPRMMEDVMNTYLAKLEPLERIDLDYVCRLWCQWTGRTCGPKMSSEFLKPSSFGAIWLWAQSFRQRLERWDWSEISTTIDQPFVTSDRPVFAQRGDASGTHLVTFPVSSDRALVVVGRGRLKDGSGRTDDVYAMNAQTISRATEFVVASRPSFPADELLKRGLAAS